MVTEVTPTGLEVSFTTLEPVKTDAAPVDEPITLATMLSKPPNMLPRRPNNSLFLSVIGRVGGGAV